MVVWSVPWVGLVLRNTQVGRPSPPPLAYPECTSLPCPPPCPLLPPKHKHTHHTHPTHPTSLPVRVLLAVCVPSPFPSGHSPPSHPPRSQFTSLSPCPPPPMSLLSCPCPCPCPGSGSVVCDRAPPKATPTWIKTSIGSKQSGVGPPATRNPTPIAMTERTAESPPRHTPEPPRPTQMRSERRSPAALDGRDGWGKQRGGA